jgi:hypothetical protein
MAFRIRGIAYFLDEEERADLSEHTNADKLDAARDHLRKAVAALG